MALFFKVTHDAYKGSEKLFTILNFLMTKKNMFWWFFFYSFVARDSVYSTFTLRWVSETIYNALAETKAAERQFLIYCF